MMTHDGVELGDDPYDEKLHAYVRSCAPRPYALVEESYESGTARVSVVGWGLAFRTGATHVVQEGGRGRAVSETPDSAADLLALLRGRPVFVVWPDAA
ncbi:hypothetical protein ACFVUW_05105 [Streptomyces xiamenensis]|uniref:hypothetical protein n=1 Tax=Streptomyces xiamenensis TaxID=408015 RepID=UPI0036E37229